MMRQAVFKLSAVHSSVSFLYDTSCFFVSCNAHRFQCGVLTQEVRCLLTQIYIWWSQLCIKYVHDELLSKQMSQQLQLHVNQRTVFSLHYSNVLSHSVSPSQWFLICLYSSFTKPAFPLTFPMQQCVYPYGNEDFFTSLLI